MKNEMWLIWKELKTRRRYKVGVLTYDNNKKIYTFKYSNPELDDAIKAGFDYFPGFPDTKKEYIDHILFTNIETRLPNKARPDYLEILNSYNLEKDSTEMDILKATRGRLITDNYEFVPAFDSNKVEFDVAGTSHCPDVKKCQDFLQQNDKLKLILEPENKHDNNAIKIIFTNSGKDYHLGYVPRYYAKELKELLRNNIEYSAMIQSLNFKSKLNDEDITAYVKLIFNN